MRWRRSLKLIVGQGCSQRSTADCMGGGEPRTRDRSGFVRLAGRDLHRARAGALTDGQDERPRAVSVSGSSVASRLEERK